MQRMLVIVGALSCLSAAGAAETVSSVRLVLPPDGDAVVGRIVRVFTRHVESRSGARVVTEGDAPLVVELVVEPGIGAEGFRISDGAPDTVRVAGNDVRGLLYGVGKLLHTSRYSPEGFTPGAWRGVSVPALPVRGMYLATHFHNFYQVAPIAEVAEYIEDLSLWGVNSFLVWFGMEEFTGMDDPKAQAMIARLRELLGVVRAMGLNVCLGCICNDGWANSPVELRADDSTVDHKGYHTRMGPRIYNLGNELCPSKPGVPEMELAYCREKLDALGGLGVDYWFVWPYDNGGCTCAQCAPWGANGYLRMAEPLARAYRERYPKGKVILGTWYFDRWAEGEWDGMAAQFAARKPDWLDYIMADNFEEYPRYPLEHGVPGGFPLLNFPDISMWGQDPWGGYGANPHPGRLQQRWDETGSRLSGGFPYSEGIYEDLNKVICARLYWDPDRPATETVRDYAAFEFSPDVVDPVAAAVAILEHNHLRGQIDESAVHARELLEQAEAKLTPQARAAWRWRLLRIRADLDQELYRNSQGCGRAQVFREAYEELMAILRARDTWPMLRPVLIAAVDTVGPELAAGYAEAVSASRPVAWWRMDALQGRALVDATGHTNEAACEDGVTVVPGERPRGQTHAAGLAGGRIRAALEGLRGAYSVEFWFLNALPNTARPVTGYLLSRGPEGPEGTPGDSLGLSGTSAPDTVAPGRLFFYNGDAAAQVVGRTEIAPESWNHVVVVRDGLRLAVYLNGAATPELVGDLPSGSADGAAPLFVGGRNDGFASLQGKLAEVAVYDRALTGEEAERHYRAAGR